MKLVLTIDTEEDNWARYSATDNPVSNIEKLIPLQQMFDRYQVRPTYLITYPVATNPRSIEILRGFLDNGNCEIGMHCHPWNTPPFEEEINNVNSMLCNLPEDLVHRKLTTLHQAICYNFGIVPVSFRSGRWGFSSAVARSLFALGYKIDTSVSSFVTWKANHGPDFRDYPYRPYPFDPDDILTPNDQGSLLQVPATVGFLQGNFNLCRKIIKLVETETGKKLRLKGLLYRTGLLNKVWLSPELSDAAIMIKLAEQLMTQGVPVLNMSFHSTTLKANLSPFVKNSVDEVAFVGKIEIFLKHTQSRGWQSKTLSELHI